MGQRCGGWKLELVRRPVQQHTFQVLPRRWVVERTFAWLGRQRRLSKDYEALPETSDPLIASLALLFHISSLYGSFSEWL